jgi:peptidyl-prolyl cis-trans isomerase C
MSRRSLCAILLAFGSAASAAGLVGAGCGNDSETPPTSPANRPRETGEQDDGRVHGLTPEQARQTLAKVGDTTITVGDFATELASKGSFIRSRYNSPERRREFLDQMIRFELLAQEARRRGYMDAPEVARTRKQMMIRRFLEQRFDEGGPDTIGATEVRAYYEAHRTEFNTPEQVRASHIQVRDRATAQRILAQLQADPTNLRLYRQLAEQNNADPETSDRFGDLRFFSRPAERTENEPAVPPTVAEAAFAIERIGDVHSEVIQSDRGFHIVKLTGRRAAMHRSLEEAERPIRNRLWRQRREEAIEELIRSLRNESDVEEDLSLLTEVEIELPEGDSPTIHPQLAPGHGPSGPLQVPTKRPRGGGP